MIVNKSTQHPSKPELPDVVRSDMKLNGFFFVPAPKVNGVKIVWIQNLDVKGSFPTWVFRQATIKMNLKHHKVL